MNLMFKIVGSKEKVEQCINLLNDAQIKFECTNNSNDCGSEYVFCIDDNDWERVQSIIFRNNCNDEFIYINGIFFFGSIPKITRSHPSNEFLWPNGKNVREITHVIESIKYGFNTYTHIGMGLPDELTSTTEQIPNEKSRGRK